MVAISTMFYSASKMANPTITIITISRLYIYIYNLYMIDREYVIFNLPLKG